MRAFLKRLMIGGILLVGFINQYQRNPIKSFQKLWFLPKVESNSLFRYEQNIKFLVSMVKEAKMGYDGGEIINMKPHSSKAAYHYYLTQYFAAPKKLENFSQQKYVIVNLSHQIKCGNYHIKQKYRKYEKIAQINNCLYLLKKNND